MSLATLKKKTQSKYNNMSVNSKQGFSLNGTTRNQGFVGQTSLSRSLPRTLYRGAFPRGHGGCCGTFPIQPMVQSGVKSLNDSSLIKPSVVSNKGMLETKFLCHEAKCNSVKPDNNHNNNTQDQYIRLLGSQTIDISGCNMNLSINSFKSMTVKDGIVTINGVETVTGELPKTVAQCKNICNSWDGNPCKTRYFTHTERIQNLQTKCAQNNPKFVPRTTLGTPFGFSLMI